MVAQVPCISHLVPARSLGEGVETCCCPSELTHDSDPDAGGQGLLFLVLQK